MSIAFDAPQSIGDDLLPAEPEETIEVATEVTGDPEVSPPVESESEPAPESDHEPESTSEPEHAERTESDDLLARIWNAEQECRRREARVEMLKEEVKEAKAQLEQSVINLRELCSEHVNSQLQPTPVADTIACESHDQPATDSAPQPPAIDANGSAWRETPLTAILDGIKGLGAKKVESLTDLCPTLGAFEDLRAKVGRDAAELHEMLPKGIGREMASALEEKLLNWITDNNKAASVETDQQAILRRAGEINDGSNCCLDSKHPEGQQWHESGWQAFGRDVQLAECPYIPGPEQDDWIRGWLAHQVTANYEQATSQESEQTQDQEEKPKEIRSLMGVSLDDL